MRYFINIAYAGTRYHGWQIQPNATTVQQALNQAIEKITREKINVVGCGRTDTGVHASYYVVHVDLLMPVNNHSKFAYQLNAVLPDDITVYEIVSVNDSMHARFDAAKRQYHYYFSKTHHPFLHSYMKRLVNLPDLCMLNKSAKLVLEQTDFASFCKAHSDNKTTICHVDVSEWSETGDFFVYRVRADRFLRNMVRALVGTMLEIGTCKRTLDDMQQIFKERDRSRAGLSVEPHGLFLTGVWYEKNLFSYTTRQPFYI